MSAVDPIGDWSGRVALVTGGAGNVGAHVVRRLARGGATVLVNCFHSYEAGKALVAELTAEGRRVELLRASVARPEQVDRMFQEVRQRHGRLDILVNNAAAGTFVGWSELTEEHLDRAFDTNVKGALWCARAARPLLAASRGVIVNVSSIGATHAPANYLTVGVSKAALEALTRYLAAEFAVDGVRVNTASAGLIDNPVGHRFPEYESVRANTVAATPLGRLATSEDLANVVLLLASPGAGWITGQTLLADGGLSLQHAAMSPAPRRPATTEPANTTPAVGEQPVFGEQPVVATEIPSVQDDPIAVVGMGLAVPGASSPEEFWTLLRTGAELFVEVPADRWPVEDFQDDDPTAPDKTYQRRSGFITDFVPHPDLAAERDSLGADPDFTMLWLRHSTHQAMTGVGRRPGDRYSVCVGYTPDGSQHLQESLLRAEITHRVDSLPEDELAALLDECLPHGRAEDSRPLPHLIGRQAVRGLLPADSRLLMVDTACSSSLYAIDLGARALLAGEADVAVCGGGFALAPGGSVLFSKLHGLSRRGAVRALDADADGVLFADGAGMIVLKRLSRALADGDTVHGVIAGVGLSADGRGKAIYAPSTAGQELAVHRALERAGATASDVDWVIAHATGTPAGDEAEFLSLRSSYRGEHPVQVTSNKSLIGHTGWAAGVVSVIHALLAMRHGEIPAQYRFTAAPESFELADSNLTIPVRPVPWPARADRARMVAVSGFGFGGTNAHLLLREHRPGDRSGPGYPTRVAEDMVLVGWSTQLPETDDPADRPVSFGERYPSPPFAKLRMPASAVRATDRTQLMIVECMQRLPEDVRAACGRRNARTGVVVGHTGPTRNAVLHALRAYLDRLATAAAGTANPEPSVTAMKQLREDATEAIGAPSEDSFPGEMPNVIAARLSNYFDLRGLNIAVDGGAASLLDAFDVAGEYLRFGDIDIALVAGVAGNTLASWRQTVGTLLPDDLPGVPAEGAFLFAVTTRSVAEQENLTVLAELTDVTGAA